VKQVLPKGGRDYLISTPTSLDGWPKLGALPWRRPRVAPLLWRKLADVAEHARVSTTTVSRALNGSGKTIGAIEPELLMRDSGSGMRERIQGSGSIAEIEVESKS
jgi:hypothetical protein